VEEVLLYHNDTENNLELIDPVKEYEDHIIDELCPNPDHMTYEQMLALEEQIGSVSKGLNKSVIKKETKVMNYTTRQFKDQDR